MLTAILKGISEILKDGLEAGKEVQEKDGPPMKVQGDVPAAYVKNAKAMLDNCIKELEKGDTTHITNADIRASASGPLSSGKEAGLDAAAQQAKEELM